MTRDGISSQGITPPSAKGKKMTGGVLVQVGENWYYPAGLIDDDNTTDGWTILDMKNL